MPSLMESFPIRRIRMMIRSPITMLSLTLRERMSMWVWGERASGQEIPVTLNPLGMDGQAGLIHNSLDLSSLDGRARRSFQPVRPARKIQHAQAIFH